MAGFQKNVGQEPLGAIVGGLGSVMTIKDTGKGQQGWEATIIALVAVVVAAAGGRTRRRRRSGGSP